MSFLSDYGVSERFIVESTLYPQYKLARVISQYKGGYKIIAESGEYFAEISGKFRYEVSQLSEYPAVGDYVMVNLPESDGHAIIQNVLTRKSVFERTAVGITDQVQIVAANIDMLFICMSLNSNYNLNRLERYLAIAWDSRAIPVVILTKSDLCDDIAEKLSELQTVAPGVDVIVTSSFDEATVSELAGYLKKGITASFIGSSGVGKSTLINKLLGVDLQTTREIDKRDKGQHTTTGRQMLLLPNGAIVIDTPGMRELGVERVDLAKSFIDIDELTKQCKFSDCTHTNEPGCAVRAAIMSGDIDERRLQNYLKLKRESKYDGLSSKEIEVKKFDAMFHEVGGMKKAKKARHGFKH